MTPLPAAAAILTLLASAASLAVAADASLQGSWRVHTSAAGRENTQTCTFTQTGEELGGTCETRGGPVKLTGKVTEGKKVTWTFKTDSEAGIVTVVFNGKMDGADKMSGILTAVEFGVDGEFKATRGAE